ncbi:hypothetical protein [Enterococcus ratti]|nr:hypothetical protein [Enterococcus ratti]
MKMKKIVVGSVILVFIGITASLGLLNAAFRYDDISEQEYQIPITKAAMLFKKETHQSKVQMVQFILQENAQQSTNNNFEYVFVGSDQSVAINPTTGKITAHLHQPTNHQKNSSFDIEKVNSIKSPQTAMKEAIKKYGRKNTIIKSWILLMKNSKLYYEITLFQKNQEYSLLIRA